MYLKYSKIKDVRDPSRAYKYDAGLDLYLPNYGNEYLSPRAGILIATGLKFEIPVGYMLLITNKGSVATNDILVGADTIDATYSGELSVHLFNMSNETKILKTGCKLAQAILIPVVHFDVINVREEVLYSSTKPMHRGKNGFGSTN